MKTAVSLLAAALVSVTSAKEYLDNAIRISAGVGNCEVVVAAADSPAELRAAAKFVCAAEDARPALQLAIDEGARLGLPVTLLKGTYVIDSAGERSPLGALVFRSDAPAEPVYARNRAYMHVFRGAKEPIGWQDGAIVKMGEKLYRSLPEDRDFSMFYCDGGSPYSRGMSIADLTVILPGNRKPVTVFDGRFAMSVKYARVNVSGFEPKTADFASARGIDVPNGRSCAFRGSAGSNLPTSVEMKNLWCMGFGTGFDVGGEHVYCETLSAMYCGYGYAFANYRGRNAIDAEDGWHGGGFFYPIVCVNLCDEHNVNMPLFGNGNHRPEARLGQSITIRGMNLQWPNTCPGHVDRTAPDFLVGRHRATERDPGSWRGSIEYVIDRTLPNGGINLTDEPFFEPGHGANVRVTNLQKKKEEQ